MSDSQLDQRQRRELVERLATKLDVSVYQLEELDWNLDENVGTDGTVYSYIFTFAPSDDTGKQSLIDRITDRQGWVQIGLEL